MDTAGLKMADGDLLRNMEETGWMTAARGGDGGPASHHYIYNTPVDYKVPHEIVYAVFSDCAFKIYNKLPVKLKCSCCVSGSLCRVHGVSRGGESK